MRIHHSLLVVAAILEHSYAQGDGPGERHKVKGQVGAENATTPHVREGDHVVHFVTVGKATNNFYPNSILAHPGDIVMFQFFPTNHSVIRAAYGYPCVPYEDLGLTGDPFFSGFQPVFEITQDPPSWNLTINDTEPVFYYCGAPGSCIDWGMVGGINLNASTPISDQIGLARKADYVLLPGEPFPSEAEQASLRSLAAQATSATFTVTATQASPFNSRSAVSSSNSGLNDQGNSNQSHGLSSGAVAGIAVGSAAVALAIAGLFLLLRRTRSLKQKLDRVSAQSPMMSYAPNGPWSGPHPRHVSQLPPYQSQEMYKTADGDWYAVGEVPSRGASPQLSQQGGQYHVHGQHVSDPRSNRQTNHSELRGNIASVSELDAPAQNQADPRA